MTHTKILTPHGMQTEIASLLRVARKTVYRALTGNYTITKKALRIRQLALEKGGVEINVKKAGHEVEKK